MQCGGDHISKKSVKLILLLFVSLKYMYMYAFLMCVLQFLRLPQPLVDEFSKIERREHNIMQKYIATCSKTHTRSVCNCFLKFLSECECEKVKQTLKTNYHAFVRDFCVSASSKSWSDFSQKHYFFLLSSASMYEQF